MKTEDIKRKFFNECTIPGPSCRYTNGQTGEQIFEWFLPYLQEPKEEEKKEDWIDAKDFQPSDCGDILLWDGYARIRGFYNGVGFSSVQQVDILCTHWMPLPEPPTT